MKKKFSLIRSVFLSNFKKSAPSPYKITFILTYKCNLRCKICKIWERPRGEELNIAEIEKIFKGLNNLCWLDLTGGEITLRKDLVEVIKAIIKSSRRLSFLHVSSNGSSPGAVFLLAKEILKLNVTPIINISVDGPMDINDELRGVEGSYLKSLETFKLLKGLGKGHYYLSCTISNHNFDHLDRFLSGLKDDMPCFSFSDIHFNVFHTSSNYYKNDGIKGLSGLRFDGMKKYLKLCENGNLIKRFLENEYIKGLSGYLDGNKHPVICQALKSSCFINPYGVVYPCGFYDRPIGDLRNCGYDMGNIWNKPDVLNARGDIENMHCPGCWTPCEAFPSILGSLFG